MAHIHFGPALVQRYKDQRRCMKCKKKTFEDLVLCERCREWQYCCIQCLESDRDYHTEVCDKIGLKKGILRVNENMHVYRILRLKAKFLDENGDVRLKNSNEENRNGASKNNKSVSETNGRKKTGGTTPDQARTSTKSAGNGRKSDRNVGKPNGNGGKADGNGGKPNGNDGKPDENGAKPGHKRKNKKNKSQRKQAQKEKSKSGESNADLTSKTEEKTVSAADQKSVLKSLSKGRFGGPVRCSKDDETGVSFGKDWFKSKPVSKTKRGVASKTVGLKSAATKPAGKANEKSFSDIYGDISDDEENRDEAKNKLKETKVGREEKNQGHDDRSQVSEGATASGGEPEVELTGQEIVVYDEETAEKEMKRSREGGKPVVIKNCYFCQKRSFNLKTCARCNIAVYCNKTCQMSDFATHKEICKRIVRFTTAREKLPWGVRHMEFLGMFLPLKISPDLADVPDPIRSMFLFPQPKVAVLLEIISLLRHPLLHVIRVKDLEGKETKIFFGEDVYFHFVGGPFKIPMRLDRCLTPGNFILLLNPHFNRFIDGTMGIIVEDLEEIHFVFMK